MFRMRVVHGPHMPGRPVVLAAQRGDPQWPRHLHRRSLTARATLALQRATPGVCSRGRPPGRLPVRPAT